VIPRTLPVVLAVATLAGGRPVAQTPSPAPQAQGAAPAAPAAPAPASCATFSPPCGPDSLPQPGVPRGEVIKAEFSGSAIYPGTWREYWVYLPPGLDRGTPAPVMVFQDGLQYNAPVVFDNLIARNAIPKVVGVFVMHGRVRAGREGARDRMNRSVEYDTFSDAYARFLLTELLPHVEKAHGITLTTDPNARAIAGNSSGAIAAFAAAWTRPDAFRRVFSAIGTYVGLRGGNNVALHVRLAEPKPIRVFLQDGSKDLNNYTGDWFLANQDLLSALTYAGYDVAHEWGDGEHNSRHATAIFPKAVEWLWKGYPAPIAANAAGASRQDVAQLLAPGEGWAPLDTHQVVDGWVPGPDGRRYAAARDTKQIVARTDGGPAGVVAERTPATAITVSHAGHVYAVDAISRTLFFVPKGGRAAAVDETLARPTGVALSADQSTLYVADADRQLAYAYRLEPDGKPTDKQAYIYVHHLPGAFHESEAGPMTVDREGRIYMLTGLGIQVFDQLGKCHGILALPGDGRATAITFGGPDFSHLVVRRGDRIYSRRIKASGAPSWMAPVTPPQPRL
jgi:enterochelin esterase-like enzyme